MIVKATPGGKKKDRKDGAAFGWHMIGYLQSNKAKYAVKLFDIHHSVDRIELARELDRGAKAVGM